MVWVFPRMARRSRPTTGHQLRSGASAPDLPEDTPTSRPGRFGAPISYVSCMPLLAGPWKPREPPHRRQVCHQLTQDRRPGPKRSGGANPDSPASHERRDENSERPKAPRHENPRAVANQLGREHRSVGPRRTAQQLGAPRHGSTTCRQRQPDSRVNLEQTAGPCPDSSLALGRVRAGDFRLD